MFVSFQMYCRPKHLIAYYSKRRNGEKHNNGSEGAPAWRVTPICIFDQIDECCAPNCEQTEDNRSCLDEERPVMPRVKWTAKAAEKWKAEHEQHERETQTPILE